MVTIDDPGKERVRAAIAAAEKGTDGEIRVLVVHRSARADWRVALPLAALLGLAAHLFIRHEAWGHPGLAEWLAAIGAGIVLGVLLAVLVARLGAARAVRRRAERELVRLGIAGTAGRTGVLLMLSAAERRAVLLADRAIHEKVKEGTWDAILARLTAAIREKRAAAGLEAAVAEIGRELGAHFPRTKGGANELPDEVEEVR